MGIAAYIRLAALATAALPVSGFAAEQRLFQFEQQAQQHCPGDRIVWADPVLHLYNVKGERWYGATRNGACLCLRDGEKAGYHARLMSRSADAD